MQIEKNIAAMLQSKMKETGKTKLEFSKELGIPRSTLQGYLKGDKCLRSDSIEEIAKRLDLLPAQLISGPAYAEEFALFLLDTLQEELRMLHPQAQGLAREAAALLRAAFRLSAEWNRLDVHPTAAKTEDPEGLTYRAKEPTHWRAVKLQSLSMVRFLTVPETVWNRAALLSTLKLFSFRPVIL